MTSSGKMVSTLEQMQIPNWTGPGVRRSKRPLLASCTRCNVLWKPQKFCNKVKIDNKVQFGNKFANWCNVLSIEGVIVYGHVPECHEKYKLDQGCIDLAYNQVSLSSAQRFPRSPKCLSKSEDMAAILFFFSIGQKKNPTNLDKDVEILLPVKFP